MPDRPFTPEERKEIVKLMMRTHDLHQKDAEELLAGREVPAKRNPLLERQWVHTLYAVSVAIYQGKARPIGLFASVFWIRLYGCLTELTETVAKFSEVAESVAPGHYAYPYMAASLRVRDALKALRVSLTEDELIFVAFERHIHAHVYQRGFEMEIEPGNKVKKQRGRVRQNTMVRPPGRHVGTDEAHAILDRIVLEHDNNDSKLLQAFVGKVQVAVDDLENAMAARDDALKDLQPASAPSG